MPRYNIVLFPQDSTLQEHFAQISQKYFRSIQSGYLLGPDALAHITLCQFEAPSDEKALTVFQTWPEKESLSLAITETYLNPGKGNHVGFFWTGFNVEKPAELLQMQANLHAHIQACGLAPFTDVKGYTPHFTLARLSEKPRELPAREEAPTKPIALSPTLGLSTPNGVLVKKLA